MLCIIDCDCNVQASVNTVPRNRANTRSVSVSYLFCGVVNSDICCRSLVEAQPGPKVDPLPLV